MLKRKKVIALVTSFSIIFSNTYNAMHSLNVFAEELRSKTNTSTNILDNTEETNNENETNENTNNQGNENENEGTDKVENVPPTNNSDEVTPPSNESSKDKIEDEKIKDEVGIVNLTESSGKLYNEVYYTNKNTITFKFETQFIDSVFVEENPSANFKLVSNTRTGNGYILEFEIKNSNVNNEAVINFKDSNGHFTVENIKFNYDTRKLNNKFNLLNKDSINYEDKDGVYYFNSKIEEFQIQLDSSKDNFGEDIKNLSLTEPNGFEVSKSNEAYTYTISNITTENVENVLELSFEDSLGNTHISTFKFIKDTRLPKVKMEAKDTHNITSASINDETIFYVKNSDNVKDIEFDISTSNFDPKSLTKDNIFINDTQLAGSKYEVNLINKLKGNTLCDFDGTTLKFKNIDPDTEYKITFKNLINNIGNESILEENTFILYQDTEGINLVLNDDDNMSFREKNKENETIYVKYDKDKVNLSFSDVNTNINRLNQIKSFKIKDFAPDKIEYINNNECILTLEDGTHNISISATDYSGNTSEKTYTIIKDSTNYSESFDFDKVETTFAGKNPKTKNGTSYKNEFYIHNTDVAKTNFIPRFIFNYNDENYSDKNFTIATTNNNGNKVYITETDYYNKKYDDVKVSVGTNSFNYNFIAKNGSLNESLNYKVNYIEDNDLNIKLTYDDSSKPIIDDEIYSDNSNAKFDLKIEIIDEKIEEVDDIIVSLNYEDTNGNPKSSKTISLSNDQEKDWFIEKNLTQTYIIDKKEIIELLDMDSKLEDGKYTVNVKVNSRFDDANTGNEGKVFGLSKTFYIDSNTPQPYFVAFDNIKGEYAFLNSKDSYINTDKVYIAIDEKNLANGLYGKFTNISINKDEEISKNISYDEFMQLDKDKTTLTINGKNYKIYQLDNSYLSENEKFDFTVKLTDEKSNYTMENDLKVSYTIDTIAPKIESIIAKSENGEQYNKELEIRNPDEIKNIDGPYINLKDIVISIEDNTNLYSNIVTTKNFLFKNTLNIEGNKIELNKENVNELKTLGIDQEGEHVVKITTTDAAGNETEKIVKFKTDTEAPTIDIGSLAKNEALGSLENVTIDLDAKSKILKLLSKNPLVTDGKMEATDYLKLEFIDRFNENNKQSYDSKTSTYNLENFKFDTSNLTEGVYDVVLTARDRAGNTSISTTNNEKSLVTIDTANPDLTVSLSEDSTTTEFKNGAHDIDKHKNTSKVVPTLEIKDKSTNKITYSLSKGQTKNNLSNILTKTKEVDTSKDGYTQTLNLDSISDNAYYNLSVSTTDRLKNETTSNITFAIDTEAPKLSLKVGNKDVTNGDKIFLNAKDNKDLIATVTDNLSTQDEIETNITINGSTKNATSHKFASDGEFNVSVVSKDKADNKSEEFNFTVIVDTVLPTIEITEVENGQHTNQDVLPKIEVKDERMLHPESAEIITLNGAPYTKDTVISAENEYELVVKATDEALNETIQTVKFVIDKTAPEFTVEGIENGKTYVEGERIIPKVKFKNPEAETDTIVSMTLNNKDYNGHEIVKDDKYVLYVTATDLASNKYEQKYEFKANLIPPEIILSKQLKTLKKAYETGKNAETSEKVKLDVTFKDALPEKCRILVNGTEYLPGDTLNRVGEYNIMITAEDEDKNKNEESFRFRIVEDEANPNSATKDKTMTASTFRLIAFGITAILLLISAAIYIIIKKKSKKDSQDK